MEINLLIKNGIIYDGTGKEPFEADIGIAGDRIEFINKSVKASKGQSVKAEKIIDSKGLAVAPGFIDVHTHSEFTLLADPRGEGKISQGITTEINGNCGLSAAPLYGDAFEHREKDLKELGIKERWQSFPEYFSILKGRGIALNFVTLAGHGNLRASVIGYKDRKPAASELKRMRSLLQKAIAAGAIGLSTGLIYPPGIYSNTEELINLCSAIRNPKSAFIYTSHMRSEGRGLIESIKEIIRIGEEANIKVHISHIKTSGKENWHKIGEAISLITNAKKRGVKVTCDRYPYTASSTDLDTILPSWTYDGGAEQELKRIQDSTTREKIRQEVLQNRPGKDYWARVSVSSVASQKNKWMEGRALYYISRKINKSPVDALFKILIEEKLRVGAIFSSMNEDNLKRFLSLPYSMIGSDSSARSTSGITCEGKPHPRGFGSFPRFLGKYVRDEKLMSMSEAIYKITMLPAKTFGISERGILKKGAFADIVVFDPQKIIDRATFSKPFLLSKGIHYVVVNGAPAVWEGECTDVKTGRVLTLTKDAGKNII